MTSEDEHKLVPN